MDRNRLWCIGILIAMTAAATWAGEPAATSQQPAGQTGAKLAIVLSDIGTRHGAIDIAYPYGISAQQAQADMAALSANTGWEPGPLKTVQASDATMVRAALNPGPHAVGSQGLTIWGLILTFRAYSSIEIVYIGVGQGNLADDFGNRYIHVNSRAQGGIASYNITVKDASFTSVDQIMAREAPQAATSTPSGTAGVSVWIWIVVAIAAAAAAWGTYRLVSRYTQGRKA